MATSTAIPGSCPMGFIPALARKRTSIGFSAFPHPEGASPWIQPASHSLLLQNMFPISWHVKLPPVGSLARGGAKWTSTHRCRAGGQLGTRQQLQLPAELFPCPLGWCGALGMQSCHREQLGGSRAGAGVAPGRGAAAAQQGRGTVRCPGAEWSPAQQLVTLFP